MSITSIHGTSRPQHKEQGASMFNIQTPKGLDGTALQTAGSQTAGGGGVMDPITGPCRTNPSRNQKHTTVTATSDDWKPASNPNPREDPQSRSPHSGL